MNIRNELKEIDKKIKLNEVAMKKLSDIVFDLRKQQQKLRFEIVKEEKLVGEGRWKLKISKHDGKYWLYANIKDFPKLKSLCADGWGLNIKFEDFYFHEHDGEMVIEVGKTNPKLKDTISLLTREYGVVMDDSDFNETYNILADQLNWMSKMLRKAGLQK